MNAYPLGFERKSLFLALRKDLINGIIIIMTKYWSSKKVRKEFPELQEFLWRDNFWADGYFAEIFGKYDERIVRDYVKGQR
jgi:REP element-mobilizing transposase RayT